jgi:hypothetical protein
VAGKFETATVPLTGWVAGKFETDTEGVPVIETLPAWTWTFRFPDPSPVTELPSEPVIETGATDTYAIALKAKIITRTARLYRFRVEFMESIPLGVVERAK